jgi:cell division protein FtsB
MKNKALNRFLQRLRGYVDKNAVVPVYHEIGKPSYVPAYHRFSAGHGFKASKGRAFRSPGGNDDNIRHPVEIRHILHGNPVVQASRILFSPSVHFSFGIISSTSTHDVEFQRWVSSRQPLSYNFDIIQSPDPCQPSRIKNDQRLAGFLVFTWIELCAVYKIRDIRLQPEIERLRNEISLVNQAIDKLNQTKAVLNMYEQTQKRLNELERQEESLASEFERLEYELHLIEEYIKTKAELLTDKINSKFRLAEFKLFETQINGGINPICETTYKGVPWGSLNSAGKVQVGLDIIRTLQDHYGLRCPVWIDNRESVVELPVMDCQVISLIVSEKDKTLRIEGATQDAATLEGQMDLFEEAM